MFGFGDISGIDPVFERSALLRGYHSVCVGNETSYCNGDKDAFVSLIYLLKCRNAFWQPKENHGFTRFWAS